MSRELKEVTEQARQYLGERRFWVRENTRAKVLRGSMFSGLEKQQRDQSG